MYKQATPRHRPQPITVHTPGGASRARSDHGIWVREGLKAGEQVVTIGAYGMDDSAKVVGKEQKPGKAGAKAPVAQLFTLVRAPEMEYREAEKLAHYNQTKALLRKQALRSAMEGYFGADANQFNTTQTI